MCTFENYNAIFTFTFSSALNSVCPLFGKLLLGTAITSVSFLGYRGHQFPSHERVTQIIIIQAPSASGIILANELWGSLELEKGTALHVHLMNLMLTVHCSLHGWLGGGKRLPLSSGSAHQWRWIRPLRFSWKEPSFAIVGFSYWGTHFVSYKKAAVSLEIWMQN